MRAAHFSPDAPNVDVYVGDHRILADVPFGAISGYTSLRPGRYRVRITAAGAPDTVAFDDHLDLPAGEFTVAATGELSEGTFEPLVLEDDAGRPGRGTTRVRVVHAAPDAPAVDVTAGDGTALFEGVAFGDSGGYATVDAGEYDLAVRSASGGDPVAEVPATFESGTVYTAFVTGYLTPDDEPTDEALALLLEADDQ